MAKKIKQKSQPQGNAKGLAISAGVGLGAGAATGATTYALFGKRVETQQVPITWDNINEDVLFKAIGKKWQSSAGDADLSTREGWLEMIAGFKARGNDALVQNATNDLYDVSAMSQHGLSFEGFTTKEQLADYISGQDVTETVRMSVADQARAAFEAKWGIPYDAQGGAFPRKILEMNNPSKTQELIEDRIMVKKWTNESLTSSDIDDLMEQAQGSISLDKDYDIPNMTFQEKCDALLTQSDNAHSTQLRDGYTPSSLTDAITRRANSNPDGQLTSNDCALFNDLVNRYERYYDIKSLRDNVAVDVSDLSASLGSNPTFDDAQIEITNNRQEMLENAIEKKYNLEDGSINLKSPDNAVLDQVDDDSKNALVDNIINSGGYIRDQEIPIPENTADMVDRVGVREIVEGFINNHDTTTVEQTVGSLGLPEIGSMSGLGTVITFGIVFMLWKHKQNKINKICAENPEAAKKYNEYLIKQQQDRQHKKDQKKAKKSAKSIANTDAKSDEADNNENELFLQQKRKSV